MDDGDEDESYGGSVAMALRSRHGHSTQPESKQARLRHRVLLPRLRAQPPDSGGFLDAGAARR